MGYRSSRLAAMWSNSVTVRHLGVSTEQDREHFSSPRRLILPSAIAIVMSLTGCAAAQSPGSDACEQIRAITMDFWALTDAGSKASTVEEVEANNDDTLAIADRLRAVEGPKSVTGRSWSTPIPSTYS